MGRYVFQSPEPFAHQVEGVRQLIAKDGRLALLWSPGCGKSRTVLDYAGTLAVGANTECRVLVVAPKCTQDSWLKEAITYVPPQVGLWARVLQGTLAQKVAQMVDLGPSWAGAAHKVSPRDLLAVGAEGERNKRSAEPGEILDRSRIGDTRITLAVINLEAFSQRQQVGSQTIADRLKNAVLSFSPHILVIDECHRLKSASGNASRLLRRIAPHIKRVILLTGTPSPHSPLDIWAQWAILDPTAFKSTVTGKPLSFQGFKDRYAETGGFMGKQVVEFRRLDELQDRIAPRSMVIRKEDALDLPPTTDVTLDIHLSPAEERVYADLKRDLLAQIDTGQVTVGNRLTQMLRLRQVTSGFVKNDTGTIVRIGHSREDAAVSLLEDLLTTEKRVVVFAWARPEVDSLIARLGPIARAITGDTPDRERMALRARFLDVAGSPEPFVLVAQIRALSLGVNELVSANHALFLSLSQQRDDLIQAKGRLDRPGQTKNVTFWQLCAPNTVDSVILQSHRDKNDLETALLHHLKEF